MVNLTSPQSPPSRGRNWTLRIGGILKLFVGANFNFFNTQADDLNGSIIRMTSRQLLNDGEKILQW